MVQLSVRYVIHSMTVWFSSPRIKSSQRTTFIRQHSAAALEVPAHVVSNSLVVKHALDAANGADGDILVPEFPLGKVHDVLLRDTVDGSLDLAGVHAAAGGDDLSADILGNGRGAVQGQKDGGLQLGLGALNLGLGNVVGEARPLAEGEVNEVVDSGKLVRDEVDTPETATWLADYPPSTHLSGVPP